MITLRASQLTEDCCAVCGREVNLREESLLRTDSGEYVCFGCFIGPEPLEALIAEPVDADCLSEHPADCTCPDCERGDWDANQQPYPSRA